MNEESTHVWLTLLKEWLDEIGCTDITKCRVGFNFMYRGTEFDLFLPSKYGDREEISLCARCNIINIMGAKYFKLSEIDLCNPNTTPSERFQPLKSYLDAQV